MPAPAGRTPVRWWTASPRSSAGTRAGRPAGWPRPAPSRPGPVVGVVRSGLGESRHSVDVAVCDADGRLVASAGDADRRLFARSCMKPLQGAVSLASIDDAGLSDEQVA